MEMVGEVRLGAPRQLVWDALNDPEVLKASIPGCEALERSSATEFTAAVTAKVGPVKAKFAGKVALSNIQAPMSYRLSGEGQGGMAGFAKSDIEVSLEAVEETTTLLRYGVKANVGGKLAQLGGRLIDTTARKMADDFFERFTVEVDKRLGSVGNATGLPFLAAKATTGSIEVGRATAASAAPTPDRIKVWIADGIAVVTLNRPDSRNAMTLSMWQAIPGVLASLAENPDVRAIILTGTGNDFCAGADIGEFADVRSSVEQATQYEVAVDACCDAVANVRKPTIAVIKGYCLGGGAHLAMSCDFRFASATAIFGIPAARLSIIYGVKGTQKLLSLVGLTKAKRILYSGQRFGADEALRIGFVDHVASDRPVGKSNWLQRLLGHKTRARVAGDPMVDARAFARSLSENAPLSIAGAKMILNGLAMGLGALEEQKAEALIAAAVGSEDYREGRTAFVEKRQPTFKGF